MSRSGFSRIIQWSSKFQRQPAARKRHSRNRYLADFAGSGSLSSLKLAAPAVVDIVGPRHQSHSYIQSGRDRLTGVRSDYPILAHADFGNPDCCGCIFPLNRGEEADIACNECVAIVRTVLSADLRATLDEMESQLVVASTICQYCGAVNLFPGFSRMMAFVCHECGQGNLCQEPPRGR